MIIKNVPVAPIGDLLFPQGAFQPVETNIDRQFQWNSRDKSLCRRFVQRQVELCISSQSVSLDRGVSPDDCKVGMHSRWAQKQDKQQPDAAYER